ncbi:MAG: hypothetical protein ACRDXX_04410 [Stackebrandtia sp.]
MSLSPSDVAGLAETLQAGKHPTVVFTDKAGQIAGRTGKVTRLEEPTEDDFVVVRFGNDELPFSTAELRVPARGELSRKPVKPKPAQDTPEPLSGPPLLDEGDNDTARKRQAKEPVTVNDQPAAAVPRQSSGDDAPAPAADKPAAARKKSSPKPKAAPEFTVTLAWKDEEWTVQAAKGTKVVAKPVPLRPAAAVSMVQTLDSPAVAAVVEEIVEQQRLRVAEEAERLRRELDAAEARLAELG